MYYTQWQFEDDYSEVSYESIAGLIEESKKVFASIVPIKYVEYITPVKLIDYDKFGNKTEYWKLKCELNFNEGSEDKYYNETYYSVPIINISNIHDHDGVEKKCLEWISSNKLFQVFIHGDSESKE